MPVGNTYQVLAGSEPVPQGDEHGRDRGCCPYHDYRVEIDSNGRASIEKRRQRDTSHGGSEEQRKHEGYVHNPCLCIDIIRGGSFHKRTFDALTCLPSVLLLRFLRLRHELHRNVSAT